MQLKHLLPPIGCLVILMGNAWPVMAQHFSVEYSLPIIMHFENERYGSFDTTIVWRGLPNQGPYRTTRFNNFFTISPMYWPVTWDDDSVSFYLDTSKHTINNFKITSYQGSYEEGEGTISVAVLPYTIDSNHYLRAEWDCQDCSNNRLQTEIAFSHTDLWFVNGGIQYDGFSQGFIPDRDAYLVIDGYPSYPEDVPAGLTVPNSVELKVVLINGAIQVCAPGLNFPQTLTVRDIMGRIRVSRLLTPDEAYCTMMQFQMSPGIYFATLGSRCVKFAVP
jgi:hypothetical protein